MIISYNYSSYTFGFLYIYSCTMMSSKMLMKCLLRQSINGIGCYLYSIGLANMDWLVFWSQSPTALVTVTRVISPERLAHTCVDQVFPTHECAAITDLNFIEDKTIGVRLLPTMLEICHMQPLSQPCCRDFTQKIPPKWPCNSCKNGQTCTLGYSWMCYSKVCLLWLWAP